MKAGALLIAMLLLAGCASGPPHCDRRLTPINTSYRAGPHARVSRP